MTWSAQIGFPILSVITFLPLAGVVLMLQATKLVPCVDCGDAEEVAAEVAAASAEMTEPIGDVD